MTPTTDTTTTKTMYLHTIDSRPANVERIAGGRARMYYLLQRSVGKLRASLSEVRHDWNDCAETEAKEGRDPGEFIQRCGYVLVRVPS
jgi:hypothetical protein